ncbi:MAG: GDP-mannose 4,6 dehydratase [Spirochaetae bacterium HGW-Spirochaetae-5]|nr:MAG: GDP-mannose 4,6 dehydratase [Spirochaetae bacterium HGW-Spirochaetae-5]
MKILITGFSGFVSRHFIDYLEDHKIKSEILGVDINPPGYNYNDLKLSHVRFEQVDLLNTGKLENIIYTFQPDYILHLASYSSVGFSWKNPSLSFRNNINIFLNLMEIVREVSPCCRVLSVGSSEEYGNVDESMLPLREEYFLKPVSPYAVARVSQEHLSRVYCDGFGLDVVMTRSFNHMGPGQKDIFVVSSFAKQLVEIKKGIRKDAVLITGDTSVIRDFLDVRDVVDAYYKLLKSGLRGEVYNICSGQGIALQQLIITMCEILDLEVKLEVDNNLIRPNDNMIIVGSNEKLKNTTEWIQKIPLYQSLNDLINYWIERT